MSKCKGEDEYKTMVCRIVRGKTDIGFGQCWDVSAVAFLSDCTGRSSNFHWNSLVDKDKLKNRDLDHWRSLAVKGWSIESWWVVSDT